MHNSTYYMYFFTEQSESKSGDFHDHFLVQIINKVELTGMLFLLAHLTMQYIMCQFSPCKNTKFISWEFNFDNSYTYVNVLFNF